MRQTNKQDVRHLNCAPAADYSNKVVSDVNFNNKNLWSNCAGGKYEQIGCILAAALCHILKQSNPSIWNTISGPSVFEMSLPHLWY